MKKISTLFKKNPENLGLVINEINPDNQWVIDEKADATRKFDGTATAIIDRALYRRYDVKKGRSVPIGAIPCQEADAITGHHPHWLLCDRSKPEDKYFFEAFDKIENKSNGTYELIGEKIQGNPERVVGHILVEHGKDFISLKDYSFESIKHILEVADIEGIVFHGKDGKMCKIRKSDYGIKR